MSLRAAIGLDHLVKTGALNSGQGAVWDRALENNIALYNYPTSTTKRAVITADGWFSAQQINAQVVCAAIFESSKLVKGTPALSWMGFRFKIQSVGNLSGNNTLAWLAARNYPTNSNYGSVISPAEMISILNLPNLAALAGVTGYFEFAIDWAGMTLHRRLNGREISSVAIPTSLKSMIDAKTICVFIPSSSGQNHVMDTRDFYWVDNDGVGLQGPLGPQRLIQLEEVIDEPTNWTLSDGSTDKAGFFTNHPFGASSVTINRPNPTEPLNVSLKLPDDATYDRINGVVSTVGAVSPNGSPSVRSSLKQGSQVVQGSSTPVTSAVAYQLPGMLAEKSVDGAEWTREKIAATKLVLESV